MSATKEPRQWFAMWRDWAGNNLVGPFPTQRECKQWIKDSLREGFGEAIKLTPLSEYDA